MSMKINSTNKFSIKAIRKLNKIPQKNSNYMPKQEYNNTDIASMFKPLNKLSNIVKSLRYFV